MRQGALAPVLLSTMLAACDRRLPIRPGSVAPVLLFDGTETSPNDVAAVEAILSRAGLGYSVVDSSQLNEMPASRLGEYRLLIVPGGNFIQIGNGLTAGASAAIRNAIGGGLN